MESRTLLQVTGNRRTLSGLRWASAKSRQGWDLADHVLGRLCEEDRARRVRKR